MIVQISLGTLMILLTVVIATVLIAVAERLMDAWLISEPVRTPRRLIKSLLGSTAAMVLVTTISTWLWAFLFWGIGLFQALEPALYFSLVAFTTLGFGDVILPDAWRLLSGFIAANGFILFGLGTAYILESIRQADG